MSKNLEKDVMISIQGTQRYPGHDDQSLELITGGRLSRKGDSWFITYKESEMTGMEGTLTTFEVAPDGAVTLRCKGTVTGEMRFQEGKKLESLYSAGEEIMLLGIRTRHVTTQLSETGGKVEVDYAMEIEHNWAGFSHYALNIQPVQPKAEQ